MTKIIAMIPVRSGSKRIPRKNIRLLNGKPLVSYIIEAAIDAKCFDEIFLNSEDEVFREIADQYGIRMYKRPAELASDEATNDDFANDFIGKNSCDILVQLLATSPFITSKDIRSFVSYMMDGEYDTLISVKAQQIECVYWNRPINFTKSLHTQPSQSLTPVYSYACSMMGWKTDRFVQNHALDGAYHGCIGNTGYFPVKGWAAVDIDNEEDFQLAEVISQKIEKDKHFPPSAPKYYDSKKAKNIISVEDDVPEIIKKDGIGKIDFENANKLITYLPDAVTQMGEPPWNKRIVDTENNSMCIICQNPGEGNRKHYHHNWNEWWYILQGEWLFEIEGKNHHVVEGDVVFIEKNKVHKITALGATPAIRMAVSRADVDHVYVVN